MRLRWPRGTLTWVAVLAVNTTLSACKPWTVRPIENAATSSQSSAAFDAKSYAESIWGSKVEPAARDQAIDVTALSGIAGERRSVLLKGQARVSDVDRHSRVGLAYLDAKPYGMRRLAMQVGPVVRGTALRDALGISFGEFVNQIDFAAAATELNALALRSALNGVDPERLKGQTITFVGAATLTDPASPAALEIVPVSLHLEASR